MFGSGQTQAQTQTVASGVDIQSSCYGGVVPVIYGRARLTGNLLWYGDFQAIPVQSSSGNGGKGGDSNHGSTSYDYKASFIFALGEGSLVDVQNVWASKTKTLFAKSNLAFATGDLGQAPWGYLTTKFPDQALSYAGTGYLYAMAYDLGQSAQMPNLSYEVTGIGANAIAGLPDADPGAVVYDILTNPRYGVGFPAACIPSSGFVVFSNYCRAAGLVISPVFDTQSDAASQLNAIVQSCNAEFVWSGSQLTIVPYGDQDLSANDSSYRAPAAPLFSLTDDDFLCEHGQEPVQCSRARPSDQMNAIRFEFLDRSNDYNANIVEAKNQAAIEAYGLRGEKPEQAHHFCDSNAAKISATLKLQRQSVRNVYSFTLGWRYCLLDPMDIVEITDSGLGLNQQWVRILSLEEDDNGNIKVTAEEYLGGTGHAPLYDFEPGSPYDVDYNVDPGDVNTPLIFEPPPVMLAARSLTAPQIMVGASGGPNWGGCEVWLSLDNATFKRLGKIVAPARQGTLSATLATHADPDTTHTLSVNLSESGGALHSGTTSPPHADADAFRTLCYVDGELIAYNTATLTAADAYGLTYLRRGVYGTTIAAHSAGTEFCRLDEAIKSFDLPVTPVSYVGQTLYLKFLSYNIYGGGKQELSDVTAIPYNPNGSGIFVFPPTGVSFTVGSEQQKDGTWISFGVVAWTASQDPLFDQYEVQYRLHTEPGPWIGWRGGKDTTSFRFSPLAPDTAYDVQVRAVRTSGPFYSAWDQALNISSVGKTTAPPAPTALSVLPGYRQLTVKWTASAENDIAWYEIWEGSTSVLGSAVRIALVNATHYIRPGLNLSDTRFYWVRAQDTSGNLSAYLGPGSATTNAVDAADITGQLINAQIADAAIDGAKLADNIIDYSKMASGYGIAASVNSLPGPSSPLRYSGSLVLLTTNAKLYRWDSVGGAWTVATDGGDITANSIVANSLVTGIITSPYVGAGAITASRAYFGDTTNFVTDSIFQDIDPTLPGGCYWSIANVGSPVIVSMGPSAGAVAMGAANGVLVATSNIPAASSLNYGVHGQMFAVKAGLNYRASCAASVSGAGVNKTATLFIQWYQSDAATFVANSSSGAYSSTSHGADGSLFSSAGGDTMLVTDTAPAGAAYARLFWCVQGGGSGAPAGTGSGWQATHMRMERQTVGTLIQNGAITTDHINVAGLDAAIIQAGTITGDRFTSNLAFSSIFTASSGTGFGSLQMNGTHATIGSHLDGPYFVARDDANTLRFLAGRLQDAWGLWIWDASGNVIFEESALGTNVVSTGNVKVGNITAVGSASVANGPFGNGSWQVAASATFTLYDGAIVLALANVLLGYSAGPRTWGLKLTVDGTDVAVTQPGVANTQTGLAISWSGTLSGSAGGSSHTVTLSWNADSTVQIDGGTLSILGPQR